MNKHYYTHQLWCSLLSFILLLTINGSLSAQTAFIGPAGGDWDNPANWTNGLPAVGNDAQLFGSASASINADLVMDFNVTSFGTITVNANVISNNTFESFFGSMTITNQGSLTINNGRLDNRGNLDNDGALIINVGGTYQSDASGTIDIDAAASVQNAGSFTNFAVITVKGLYENRGTVSSVNTFNVTNGGTLQTTGGLFTNEFGGNVNIAAGGIFQIDAGTVSNQGNLNNSGTIENKGILNSTGNATFTNDNAVNNRNGATLLNGKTFTNNATFLNEGGANFINNFDFDNTGTVNSFGSIDNNGQLNNSTGNFTVETGSTLTNDLGSTVSNGANFFQNGEMDSEGSISNTGTFTNNGTIGTTVNGRIDNLSSLINNGIINNMAMVFNTVTGTLENNGTISNDSGGNLNNDGTLNNNITGLISNDFNLVNNSQLTNVGTISNGVRIFNNGTMTNQGMLTNIGDFFNNSAGTLINDNIVQNNESGILTNNGVVNNNFTFSNDDCATIVNNGTFNNNFDFTNTGVFYQLGTYTGNAVMGQGFELSSSTSQDICDNIDALVGPEGITTLFGSTLVDDALVTCTGFTFFADGQNSVVFDCDDVGQQIVEFTIEDRLGNSATCQSTVTVIENTPPIFSNCPTTITVEADVNGNAVVNWTVPTASDNNGVPTVTNTNNPGEIFTLGQTTVTYSAVDCNNNVGECAFNINVVPPSCFPGRTTDGLLALYDFTEGLGNTVADISGVGTPLNLTIGNVNNVNWLPDCGLSINSNTLLQSAGPATKIIDAVKTSNAITMEAWVQPANTTQNGPARILTISKDTGKRNATLGQDGNKYAARLRTTTTTQNGMPNLNSPSNSLTTGLEHVVYTRDAAGNETLYRNGIVIKTGTRSGNMSGWDDTYKIALGNELTGNRPWLGSIYLAAVYGKALSQAEVNANFSQGQCCEITPPMPMSCSPDRVVDGLVALYEFTETTGNTVNDLSGFGEPENLTIQNPQNTTWLPECGLTINSGTIIESAAASSKIITAVKQTNAITMEAWVTPANIVQGGPARIATISANTGNRNATLGQEGNKYVARLRTTSTNNNGMPNATAASHTVQTNLQHVVYTRDASGNEKIYVDGVVEYSGTRAGSMSNWNNNYKFALGNELTLDRAWLGTIFTVAVYNRALSQGEVNTNFGIGPCCGDDVQITEGWSFDCDDEQGRRVEMIGKGIKNAVPVSIDFSNTASIYQVVVEVVYKGGNPGSSIQIQDDAGNSYTAFRETPVGGSSNVFVYRATLPATSSISYSNQSNENKAQSILAYVFRQNQTPIIQQGQFTYISGYRDIQTLSFDLPTSATSRDIDINLPFSEITDDCRILNITASAGGVSETVTIDAPDASLGTCCLNIVPIHLDNVPGSATDLVITIESPTGSGCNNGQSYVVAGAVCVDIACNGGNVAGTEAWLEAECAEVGNTWDIIEDASVSGGFYTMIQPGNNAYSAASTNPKDWVRFHFEVSQAGAYKVFGRVRAPNGGDNSFWVRANGGTWVRWNDIAASGNFIWDQVHDNNNGNAPVSFNLVAGANTVDFAYREDGTALDKVYVTLNGDAPADAGEMATNCEEACATEVLFVVGNPSLNVGDAAILAHLEEMGMNVTIADDNGIQTTAANGKDLIVISSTTSSGNVNSKFRDTAVPVLVWEAWLYDDFKMTSTGSQTNFGNSSSTSQLVISNPGHPLAAGLSGTVEITSNNHNVMWGKPNNNAIKIGHLNSDASKFMVFAYEAGAEMVGLTAPARRVGFYLTNSSAVSLTDNGWALFTAAINWARSCGSANAGLVQQTNRSTATNRSNDIFAQSNLENNNEVTGFNVFPNPSSDIFNLEIGDYFGEAVNVTVFDQLGRQRFQFNTAALGTTQLQVNAIDWENGIYMMQVEVNGEVLGFQKLMVLRM